MTSIGPAEGAQNADGTTIANPGPRHTIGDIASSPRCGDEVRLFAGLVVYQVERVDGEVPGYHWRVICRREETPPSGSTRTVSHSTWPSLQPSTWADVCRAACSWEPAP